MQQELSTTSILSLFETTKEERQTFCIDLISRLESGEADPLKIHLQIKSAEDLIKQLNENRIYKSFLLEAAQLQGGKSFEFHNAKFEIKEVGTKYDYSQCNDSVLAELERGHAALSEALKARQKFLQTVPGEGMTIVSEGGEVNTVYPPSKQSTTAVAVTLR